jgi:hypothetical protein
VATFGGHTYSNGAVPAAILAPLDGQPEAALRRDAARAWNRARAEVRAATGIVLRVRGWNRTYREQVTFYLQRHRLAKAGERECCYWQGRPYVFTGIAHAAPPGTSNHGLGLAVDVADFGGVGQFAYPRRVETIGLLKRHGWTDDEGRGHIQEPWHLVYDPARDAGRKASTMTYSPLTNEVMPPTGTYKGGKKWSARPAGVRINGLNVHHHAATSDAGISRLVTSNDPASANYIIRNNGSLIGSVPEQYRAWTTSSYAADDDKITVEIQNETGAPTWRISAAAMATLIRLYADLARRYKFAPVRANIKGHQEYGVATACPGPYLLPRLGYVATEAAKIRTGGTTTASEEIDMAAKDEILEALKKHHEGVANILRRVDPQSKEAADKSRWAGSRIGGTYTDESLSDVVERIEATVKGLAAVVEEIRATLAES